MHGDRNSQRDDPLTVISDFGQILCLVSHSGSEHHRPSVAAPFALKLHARHQ